MQHCLQQLQYLGINTANNAKKIAFGTEINMIQTAVDAYYTQNNATFPVKDTVVLNISNVSPSIKGQFSSENIIDNSTITLCEIDYSKIGIDSLTYGKKQNGNEDVYVVSRETGNVYYALGINIGDEIYYSLTDDIKNILNYNSGKNTVNSPVILFEANTLDWTNKEVKVLIKVPVRYENVSVKVDNEVLTLEKSTTSIASYNVYEVSKVGNYHLSIEYTDNGIKKEASYTVSNYDKVLPTIKFSDTQVKVENEDYLGYQEINSVSDDLSGIKKIRYDYGEYTGDGAKKHFENGGIKVEDNIIYLKNEYNKVTVYVEDNAGNYVVNVLSVTI